MPRTCFCNDLDQCSRCRVYETDPAYAEWALLPRGRSARCRHRGAGTRRVEGLTPAGQSDLQAFACARHGECTAGTPAPGLACCAVCPDHESDASVADPGRVRHLIFHVYPHAANGGEAWRWNVAQLRRRIALFNGRRVIGVATGPDSEPASAVRAALAGLGCEFVERPNDPSLGEMTTFPALLEALSGLKDSGHATFYGHTKGVTSGRWSTTVRRWAESMYESCLDYWPLVRRLLKSHPLVGPWKRTNFGWPGHSSSTWHISGTFRWSRNADLYARNWRQIDRFWSGSESHPSLHFRQDEAATLVREFGGDGMLLYSEESWRRIAEPALETFRREHAADRWTPSPPPDFAVVCIVHEEGPLVAAFVDHYLSQGARRVILVDNESADGAVETAARRPGVEARRLASGGLDDELRTTMFQRTRESLADLDWVILVDADEFIVPKFGETIREALATYADEAALGTEGWDVVQGPGEGPLDWTLPILPQRGWGVPNPDYGKPVVLRPGSPERLHCGQHYFREPHSHPAERPFWLFHLAAADERLFLERRRRMTARQTENNVRNGLGVQHTNQSEADIRRRWEAAVADPRLQMLPGHSALRPSHSEAAGVSRP